MSRAALCLNGSSLAAKAPPQMLSRCGFLYPLKMLSSFGYSNPRAAARHDYAARISAQTCVVIFWRREVLEEMLKHS